VKKLPESCSEAELSAALSVALVGPVTGIKLLKNRRAIVDCSPTSQQAVDALTDGGTLTVRGQKCPILRPDDGGILPGASGEPDPRALATYSCPVCALEFETRRKLEAHLGDGLAHRPPPPAWRMERLGEFDLSPQTMVAVLSAANRTALDEYLLHVAPQWPELPAVLSHVATHHANSLRLKELFETMECFRVVGQFIWEKHHQAGAHTKLDSILDLACGHGLLGVLLAYRFPDVQVTCVDLEPRACLEHYREAFVAEGRAAAGHSSALDNLRFTRLDVADAAIGPGTAAVCVHACNEANLIILRR
jgi:hypothetical protein